MMPWTDPDIILYPLLFNIANNLVGHQLNEIVFYLDYHDQNFTEQPNNYGKSLLNGFDIKVDDKFYSIGNRFTDRGYGLTISHGRTSELEYLKENKAPTTFPIALSKQIIKTVDIYWMKIPWDGAVGFYPQEIEITTENGFLLVSSIEVNEGEVNTEFTDEILLIDSESVARQLKLGRFGLSDKGRKHFRTFSELQQADENR